MIGSSYKRYRRAGMDPQGLDPRRVLLQSMQQHGQPEVQDPGFIQRPPPFGGAPDTGFQHPPFGDPNIQLDPGFTRSNFNNRLDGAEALAEESDIAKSRVRTPSNPKGERRQSQIAGLAAGLAAAFANQSPDDDGFSMLARGFAGGAAGAAGSMERFKERKQVEEARELEIEEMFFSRSVKLQELAQRRREADAEAQRNSSRDTLARERFDLSQDRMDLLERRFDETSRHNKVTESTSQKNADTARINAFGGKGSSKNPKDPDSINDYALRQTAKQFGKSVTEVQELLELRDRKTTAAYNRYRSEGSRTNVNESALDEDESSIQ